MSAADKVNGHLNGASGFVLKDATVENLRPLRIVVVGAGFSGIQAAIRCVVSVLWVYVLSVAFDLHVWKNTRETEKCRPHCVRKE